jgi:hypothetical protein
MRSIATAMLIVVDVLLAAAMGTACLVGAMGLGGCAPQMIGAPHARMYMQNKDCLQELPDAPSQWARNVMCGGWQMSPEVVAATPLDLDADPVTPAAMVAACAASTLCDSTIAASGTSLAFAWDLAMRVDPDAVEAALAHGSLPAYMQKDFVARYRAAQAQVKQSVESLGAHWRDLFLRPMTNARAERAADDEVLAEWGAMIDELAVGADKEILDEAPEAKTLEQALAMRRNYVTACRKVRESLDACLGDGHGRKLTELVRRLAEALKDGALLAAENELRRVADYSDPRTSVWIAIHDSLDAERARFAEYAAARDQGISPEALADRWPELPLDIPPQDTFLGIPPPEAGYGWYSSNDTEEVVEAVRAVKHSGGKATILFRKDVYRGYESTGCYETNKVDGVDEYGHLIYRTNCTGERAYTDDRTLKPVTVPWVEVAKVKAGEVIHVVVDRKTRKGHVAWVGKPRPKDDVYSRDTERVQTREWR